MINEIQQLLSEQANEEKSATMSAYLKHQFLFLGVMKPVRVQVQKEWLVKLVSQKEINWELIHQLWLLEGREYQYVALDYLVKMKKYLVASDIEQLKWLIVTKSWWDTIDLLASHLVGELCRSHPEVIESHLKSWSVDINMWLRRSAILFQLKYKDQTNRNLLANIINENSHSKEFFIGKAIGWALREYSKTNQEWVRGFIENHDLQPLSVREGRKYL